MGVRLEASGSDHAGRSYEHGVGYMKWCHLCVVATLCQHHCLFCYSFSLAGKSMMRGTSFCTLSWDKLWSDYSRTTVTKRALKYKGDMCSLLVDKVKFWGPKANLQWNAWVMPTQGRKKEWYVWRIIRMSLRSIPTAIWNLAEPYD